MCRDRLVLDVADLSGEVADLIYLPSGSFVAPRPPALARRRAREELLTESIAYTPRPGRHSSAVEQLFRKSLALCAVLQAWGPDTNGHSYQLFVSRGCPSRIVATARFPQGRPKHSKSSHKSVARFTVRYRERASEEKKP
jgi:hypothetical protein